MTREEIQKLNFVEPSDYLRTFLSVAVVGGVPVNQRDLPARTCPFQFFVDGVQATVRGDVDLPRPGEIDGIEVDTGAGTIPLQYKTYGGDALHTGPSGSFAA